MEPRVREEIRQLEELDRAIERGIADVFAPKTPIIPISALGPAPTRYSWDDGTKFPGGFGPTQLLITDYWSLRARSIQLFETNLYARGLIRRFVTNVINTGLHLEADPDEDLLGLEEDALADWSEHIENRFRVWEKTAWLCDYCEQSTFGTLQADAYREALIAGDVLCVLQQDQRTGLPRIRLVSGSCVQTPLGNDGRSLGNGNRIVHGVEIDKLGRHVAYWVRQQEPGSAFRWSSQRLPAWGEKSGRRLAWLVFGMDRRLGDVRGKPLLALILQSLREIDRYRDSVQRKAVINSMLAMFIKKGEDKQGTLPITGGAIRRGTVVRQDGGEETPRVWHTAEHIPGFVLDELQQGEEPVPYRTDGTLEQFGTFEEAVVQAFAWATETPPEILRLAFSNNYSASQAAINEYKMFLTRVRTQFGDDFCAPIYQEWLVSETLTGKIAAPGLLDAWRDWRRYDEFGGWAASDWAGQIKPAVDLSKLVGGYQEMCTEGFVTRDRAARELTGMKFSKVVKRLRIENEQLRAARTALEPEPAAPSRPATPAPGGPAIRPKVALREVQ